jgi:hypothetical protein
VSAIETVLKVVSALTMSIAVLIVFVCIMRFICEVPTHLKRIADALERKEK